MLTIALILIAILVTGVAVAISMHIQTSLPTAPVQYSYIIVKTYPHDNLAFTEGLLFDGSDLYESTGKLGNSSLRRVDLSSGEVEKQVNLSDTLFGEGLAIVNDSLVQLTWQNRIGFVYDKETFALLNTFSYQSEGWGLTFDGKTLVMSDGSANLYYLDPITYQTVSQITVKNGNSTVTNINELEYVNGDIYANIWHTQTIVIINPQNGYIKGWIDLTGIYQPHSSEDVLNGIAYDKSSDRLLITGKYWPNLYEIIIVPK